MEDRLVSAWGFSHITWLCSWLQSSPHDRRLEPGHIARLTHLTSQQTAPGCASLFPTPSSPTPVPGQLLFSFFFPDC